MMQEAPVNRTRSICSLGTAAGKKRPKAEPQLLNELHILHGCKETTQHLLQERQIGQNIPLLAAFLSSQKSFP